MKYPTIKTFYMFEGREEGLLHGRLVNIEIELHSTCFDTLSTITSMLMQKVKMFLSLIILFLFFLNSRFSRIIPWKQRLKVRGLWSHFIAEQMAIRLCEKWPIARIVLCWILRSCLFNLKIELRSF